jgi:parallel beta-helix repeat protein
MSKSVLKKIVWTGVLATMSSSVYAVDGVVLIDQNHALAGNITPGDAPGFPVTITQPGSYKLSSNLTVPDANTTAIQITSNNVTLDLNGFSIIGPVVCTSSPAVCPAAGQGNGIQADAPPGQNGPSEVRIMNGAIRGVGATGVLMTGLNSSVEKVTVESASGAGFVVAGRVTDSGAIRNGSFGILAVTVRTCTATDNHNEGILVDGSGGVAEGNIASFNGRHGISAPNATVIGNTMVRNSLFGITAVCPSVIVNNTVVSNTMGSIQLTNLEPCVNVNNATRP